MLVPSSDRKQLLEVEELFLEEFLESTVNKMEIVSFGSVTVFHRNLHSSYSI